MKPEISVIFTEVSRRRWMVTRDFALLLAILRLARHQPLALAPKDFVQTCEGLNICSLHPVRGVAP
jgi:hypothetical protein